MRVLLVVPTYNYKYTYPTFAPIDAFPIGLAYLASALKNGGHQVFGLNLNNDTSYSSGYEMIYDKIQKSLHEVQPELIGVGGLCTDYKFLKDAIKIIRKLAPHTPIVCGGGIINNDAEFIFGALHPDFCIVEESEEIIVQLANRLQSGNKNYELIPNLGYWDNGAAKFTKENFNYGDINSRSFPDYEPFGIKDVLDNYSMAVRYDFRYSRLNPRPMIIVTARQCPFNCSFCVHAKTRKYRARSVENIMQEIGYLYEKYNFNILQIQDELFAINKSKLMEFCDGIQGGRRKHGWDFDWEFQTHANANLDRESLDMAKKSGCLIFGHGVESGSPRVLASMNKKIKPSQIANIIETANAAEMAFSCQLIFGDIAETPETICESMDFFTKHCLDIHIHLDFIQPYPGSKLYEYCREKGFFPDRLDYYEHISERIWNMTSMPDKLWIPWAYLLSHILKVSRSTVAMPEILSYPWVKATDALSCVEAAVPNNPMGLYFGTSIHKITAKCPYCNREVCYHESILTSTKKANTPPSLFNSVKSLFHSIFRIIRAIPRKLTLKKITKAKIFLQIVVWYILNFRNPVFVAMLKSIKPILCGTGGGASFHTGCTHCHKRIKINLPMKDPEHPLKVLVRRSLFKCIRILSGI